VEARIEDIVEVTESGSQHLNTARDLQVVGAGEVTRRG